VKEFDSGRLAPEDLRALAEFRYQIRRFLAFSEQAALRMGLEPQQHQLLLAVQGMPVGARARIAAVAERLQIRHHSAVELIARTESRGLVKRVPSESDRREVIVRLTPHGKRILDRLSLAHHDELQRTGPMLAKTLENLTSARSLRHARARTRPATARASAQGPDRTVGSVMR
jgi:DNA-binding MarR family transcriptional regulator